MADPERIVVECCAAGTPAVVTLCEGGPGLRAAFTAFRDERVELELVDPSPDGFSIGAVCHVSFLYRGRPIFFTAPVRETGSDRAHALVWLAAPTRVTSESVRSAFRIPAGSEITPTVEVHCDDGPPSPATVVNISLTGVFLRFQAPPPPLLPEQIVELAITVEDEVVRLAGVVRRVEASGAAFFFPDAVSDAPENPIRRAVAALERDWHSLLRR